MAMGLQQPQHTQGSPPIHFPGDFVEYGQQYDNNSGNHSDPSSSQQRQSRGEGGRNGRYRRPRSPSLDDDSRFTTGPSGGEDPRASSDAALHDAVLAQAPHQQQRVIPTNGRNGGQPRAAGPRAPPAAANASQNRRSQPPPVNSQLPPYMGENPDEWSPSKDAAAAAAGAGGYSRRRTERHARRQSSTGSRAPGAPDPPQMSGGASPREPPGSQHSPRDRLPSQQLQQQQQQQHMPNPAGGLRPPSPPAVNESVLSDISRVNSPSISKSVLEPLQRKMLEYHRLMDEAQGQMAQYDEELSLLQERRRLAEQRFVDAKGKHDEYERQHLDVERALRGDYAPPQQQHQQQMMPQQSQQQMYQNSPPRTVPRPASSIMSYDDRPMSGHSSGPKKGKLRFSLFGR
ncbi:hypothetical protein BDP55DRAFT_727710 [Colletotrichum godetiae]|uniref:Uncharacterized protein n=1 Tax=Colletotrichum godetiae TaxID=1209918 RepID=A0AAJ0EU59_9PEZI|nr:uncharacterized protein BDP55DRAFT_727710 [Colletotrichum godetiae]KAK1676926.1 hypothetical protein BDP55DRAFT_727710 [Colletotrichum godetiae]